MKFDIQPTDSGHMNNYWIDSMYDHWVRLSRRFEQLETRCLLSVTPRLLSGITFRPPEETATISDSVNAAGFFDFSGDGNQDFVYSSGSEIHLLGAKSDGDFWPVRRVFSSQYSLGEFATADLNNDGRLDMVVHGSTNRNGIPSNVVLVLHSEGDGGAANLSLQQTIESRASSIDAMDLNGDGHVELILTDDTVDIYNGSASGTFATPISYLPGNANQKHVQFADADQDGDLDMYEMRVLPHDPETDSQPTEIVVTENDQGVFDATLHVQRFQLHESNEFLVQDLDQNGTPDLILFTSKNYDFHVEARSGLADGKFEQNGTSIVTRGRSEVVEVADVNGDGLPDVLMGQYGSRHLFLGDAVLVMLADSDDLVLPPVEVAAYMPIAINVADLSGDSLPDLTFAGNRFRGASIHRVDQALSGAFHHVQHFSRIFEFRLTFSIGDVNRDSLTDYAVSYVSPTKNADGSPGLSELVDVLFARRDGSFHSKTASSDFGGELFIGNFDSDPSHELLSRVSGDVTVVNFDTEENAAQEIATSISGTVVGHLDGNGDGIDDLIVSSESGTWLWHGSPLGKFTRSAKLLVQSTSKLLTDDFNDDGKPDIVLFGRGDGAVMTNSPDGSFETLWEFPGQAWLHDFDNDGNTDIAVQDDAEYEFYYGSGNAGFDLGTTVTADGILQISDADGDSLADLLFVDGLELKTLRGKGRSFGVPRATTLPHTGKVLVRDVDMDGEVETVVVSEIEGAAVSHVRFSVVDAGVDGQTIATTTFPASVARVEMRDVDNDGESEVLGTSLDGIFVFDLNDRHDVNRDGRATGDDVDALCSAVHQQLDPTANYDLNDDGQLNVEDVESLLQQRLGTVVGDVNLDGMFNSSDLISIFQSSEYEDNVASNSTWREGDWNCDGDFTTSDLIHVFAKRTYLQQAVPRSVVAATIDLLFEDRESEARI